MKKIFEFFPLHLLAQCSKGLQENELFSAEKRTFETFLCCVDAVSNGEKDVERIFEKIKIIC